MMLYNECFLTGADEKQEWMITWFFDNYRQYNSSPVVFADFGLSESGKELAQMRADHYIDLTSHKEKGWFLKPKALMESPSKKTVWIDLDCEVIGNIDTVFNELELEKLAMVVDHPWKKRRGELWHNSGFVGINGKPAILSSWISNIQSSPHVGDQEVLHAMLSPITKIQYIKDLPHKYNVLRIDVLDNNVPKDAKVFHWTGAKGKDEIRRKMNA